MDLHTTIDIDAPPETVWRVLTAFEQYDLWNPFMSVAGRPTVGARLAVELRPPGKRPATFRPTVTVADTGRELRWVGHLGVRGLYDGEHRFVLKPLAGGRRTRLVHAERFSGVLAGLVNRWLGDATERGFRAMNEALQTRAEVLAAAESATATDAGVDSTGDGHAAA
ncbi:SRPBCC family protein [Halobium salinum]|uniref:SRPBCC family protein n=1 Tax=Halobium salinum TaxID=1364940 RepID=A0ABD5PG12_9EURY|nr:SRPBCC domain-containing protein [Halobium salinum]